MFEDGDTPDKEMIVKWMNIVDKFFMEDDEATTKVQNKRESSNIEKRIGVHCVAGLGRAPLLVAIALVNKGCKPPNAIELIRSKRKGAFNLK